MEWNGEGTVIARLPHGEHAVILDVLTLDAGRLRGLLAGGASPRRAAMTQLGTRLRLRWRGRSEAVLGSFTAEPLASRAALLSDPDGLAGLSAICALLAHILPERVACPALAFRADALLDLMITSGKQGWAGDYLAFEMALLEEAGMGLDLAGCALTGQGGALAYVSPRTGRGITLAAAMAQPEPLRARLLSLPAVLGGAGPGGLAEALALTGHFLHRRLGKDATGRPLPAARDRLAGRLLLGG